MKRCYTCGSEEELTDDHVPPANLFPHPRPSNLITVKCCRKCNTGFSLDDEAFRVFITSVINRSPAGEIVWNQGVVASSFARSPKLKENVRKHLVPIHVQTNIGTLQIPALKYPIDRANRYLTRITKGLIAHFYPEVVCKDAVFRIKQLNLTQETVDEVLLKLMYDERGENVFRFWRALSATNGTMTAIWVYVFYDALSFMVEVENLATL